MMDLKKSQASVTLFVSFLQYIFNRLTYIIRLGLCNPLPLSETEDSVTTEASSKQTSDYELIPPNTESVNSVSVIPPGLNKSENTSEHQLSENLDKSLMSQICAQTISNNPKDSSMYLSVQLLCELNKELTLLHDAIQNMTQKRLESSPTSLQTEALSSTKTTTKAQGNISNSEHDEDDLLLEGYDKEFPPKLNENLTLPDGRIIHLDRAVTVKSYIFIRSIRDVDEINEKVTIDMDLYLFWMDGRIRNELRSKGKKLKLNFKEHEPKLKKMKKAVEDKIWIPDVFFEEAEKVNRPKILDEGGQVVLIYEDYGAPFLRLRMRVTLDCGMDFYLYPADLQKCQFHLRSSSYKSDEVHLTWWKQAAHGVYLSEISDPNFDFQITGVEEYDNHIDIGPESPEVRKSSHLKFELWIRRKMSYHIIQTYLPSVFFIIVTWLAYLIPPRMVEARIGVTMTTLLTMTSMFSSIRENTPIVGYVKAIDIWMVNCVFFVFLTLIDLTVTACIRSVIGQLKKKEEELGESGAKLKRIHLKMKFLNMLEVFLESYMVFVLCSLFVLFVYLYWSWLFNDSPDYLTWAPNSTYNRI